MRVGLGLVGLPSVRPPSAECRAALAPELRRPLLWLPLSVLCWAVCTPGFPCAASLGPHASLIMTLRVCGSDGLLGASQAARHATLEEIMLFLVKVILRPSSSFPSMKPR